jgi:hypothetical protein
MSELVSTSFVHTANPGHSARGRSLLCTVATTTASTPAFARGADAVKVGFGRGSGRTPRMVAGPLIKPGGILAGRRQDDVAIRVTRPCRTVSCDCAALTRPSGCFGAAVEHFTVASPG